MKKYFIKITLFIITQSVFFPNLNAQIYNRVLSEGFNGGIFPPAGWVLDSANGSSSWKTTGISYEGAGAIRNESQSIDGDAWIFTPAIPMVAGKSYYAVYYVRVTNSSSPENLKVTIGDAQSIASQVDIIKLDTGLRNTLYKQSVTKNFEPATDGNYYIGFQNNSKANGLLMFLDSINIYEVTPLVDAFAFFISGFSENMYYKNVTNIPMIGKIRNQGKAIAPVINITRTITPGGYINTQVVNNLAGETDLEINFPDFTGWNFGTKYTITDSVYMTGDMRSYNDIQTVEFTPQQSKNNLILAMSLAPDLDSLISHLNKDGLSNTYDVLDLYNDYSINSSLSNWNTIYAITDYYFESFIRDSLKSFLDNSTYTNKKTLLVFGNDIGFYYDQITFDQQDSLFYTQYLKSQYIGDDWINNYPSTNGNIVGFGSFTGILSDSIIDPFPDYVKPVNGGIAAFAPSYSGSTGDTACAVYYEGAYNMFYATNLYSAYYNKNNTSILNRVNNWLLSQNGTLPVKFISFDATKNSSNIDLTWSTAQELNNKHFEIERSWDGITFIKIGEVAGFGNSTQIQHYFFSDPCQKGNVTTIYYRLKQVDVDGKWGYSKIVSVNIIEAITASSTKKLEVNITPNPANDYVNITVNLGENEVAKIELLDITGNILQTVEVMLNRRGNNININTSQLQNGIYFVKLMLQDKMIIKKLVKSAPY